MSDVGDAGVPAAPPVSASGPASAGQYGQPLLPPYQPPVPTFKSMQPPPFPSLAPVQQHEAAAAASLPASTPEPVQELVRQAEALRHSLAQVGCRYVTYHMSHIIYEHCGRW